MSSNGKSIRGSLAGKELIGFKKSSEQDDRALERASSAKVGPTKAPEKPGLPEHKG